jgi:hypothetical protein
LKQEVSQKNNRDEQTGISSARNAAEPKALLTLDERPAVTPAQRTANPALDEEYRAKNAGGKSPNRKQCAKARRQKCCNHRTAKNNNGND